MRNTLPSGVRENKPRRSPLPVLLGVLVLFALAACGPANAGPGDGNGDPDPSPNPDPTTLKPSAEEVLALDNTFDFEYMPGAAVDDLEWDVEVEYDTDDVRAVFDHYHGVFTGLGFAQRELDEGSDEIEAEYFEAGTNRWIEIEVELDDDDHVEVDLDIEDPRSFAPPPDGFGFSLTTFVDLEIPFYAGADIRDLEWDFNFDHPATDTEEVWNYYDGLLQDLGWNQIDLDDDDDDEWEAEYERDRVFLELEVEDDDDGVTEVEIEFNDLRFYQSR